MTTDVRAHTVDESEREKIVKKLTEVLRGKEEVIFAYLHGSFLTGNFRDVDVAVYLTESKDVSYELNLEVELKEILKLPVDVRILNSAPLSFRFNVIKNGLILFSRDERARSEFESRTISEYHDFAYFRKRYRREALGI